MSADFRALDLSRASAILVRRGAKIVMEELIMADWPEGTPSIPVLVVDDLDDVRALDEDVMRAAGWVKANA